ncbi:hypothetical protein ABZP36_035133 [Zizania latifolia]
MEGHGDDGLRDLFSQPDPVFPATGYDFFSQAESSQAPRAGMQTPDLNLQVKDFPNLTSYSEMLRGDGLARGCASRTLGLRAPRNGGRGDGRVVRGGGRARSLFSGRRGGSLAESGADGGGHGGSMAEGGVDGGGYGGSRMTDGGRRGRRGTMSAGDAEAMGEDNFIDVDEENGEDDVEEQGIFPGSQREAHKHPKLAARERGDAGERAPRAPARERARESWRGKGEKR